MRQPSYKNLHTSKLVLVATFEIRTNFSLALKNGVSYTRGFTVLGVPLKPLNQTKDAPTIVAILFKDLMFIMQKYVAATS